MGIISCVCSPVPVSNISTTKPLPEGYTSTDNVPKVYVPSDNPSAPIWSANNDLESWFKIYSKF